MYVDISPTSQSESKDSNLELLGPTPAEELADHSSREGESLAVRDGKVIPEPATSLTLLFLFEFICHCAGVPGWSSSGPEDI